MVKVNKSEVYTTEEAQDFLKISNSTMKRYLKKEILRANKIGGRYKILGKEILRVVSPRVENKTKRIYKNLKERTKKKIQKW